MGGRRVSARLFTLLRRKYSANTRPDSSAACATFAYPPVGKYALFNFESRRNLRPPGKGIPGFFEIHAIARIRNNLRSREIESNMANAIEIAIGATSAMRN